MEEENHLLFVFFKTQNFINTLINLLIMFIIYKIIGIIIKKTLKRSWLFVSKDEEANSFRAKIFLKPNNIQSISGNNWVDGGDVPKSCFEIYDYDFHYCYIQPKLGTSIRLENKKYMWLLLKIVYYIFRHTLSMIISKNIYNLHIHEIIINLNVRDSDKLVKDVIHTKDVNIKTL